MIRKVAFILCGVLCLCGCETNAVKDIKYDRFGRIESRFIDVAFFGVNTFKLPDGLAYQDNHSYREKRFYVDNKTDKVQKVVRTYFSLLGESSMRATFTYDSTGALVRSHHSWDGGYEEVNQFDPNTGKRKEKRAVYPDGEVRDVYYDSDGGYVRHRVVRKSEENGGLVDMIIGATVGGALGAAVGGDVATAATTGALIGAGEGEAVVEAAAEIQRSAQAIQGGDGFDPTLRPSSYGASESGASMDEVLDRMAELCGMRYRGTRDPYDHGRFYCMRAYQAQCQIKGATEAGTAQGRQAIEAERRVLEQMGALVPNCPHVQ